MRRGIHRGALAAVALVVLGGLIAGCAVDTATDDASHAAPAETDPAGLLPERHVSGEIAMRVADGVLPPTNRWYSGLAFGAEPTSVYPYPLAFTPTGSSFEIDVPAVNVTANTIAASAGAGLVVGTEGISFAVTRHDPVSVTLRYADATGPVGDVTIAEGWPAVGFVAARATALTVPAALVPEGQDAWSVTAEGRTYGVLAPDGEASGATLTLRDGASAQWFAVPEDSSVEAWARALGEPVAQVETSFDLDDTSATTRLRYGAEKTVLVAAPGQPVADGCALGTFGTAYGRATPCQASELVQTAPRLTPTASFDLESADAGTRERILAALRSDLAGIGALPSDTYGGGKVLAKIGALGLLARSLGEEDLASEAAHALWAELSEWMEPRGCTEREARCFVYDPLLRTVVGLTPSFGSEEANDHHFHYGYFFSAAAALATLEPERIDAMRPVMSALAADIATGDGVRLPYLRNFDPYRGHSWAAGLSPFADGNNQESTSEAVSAWNSLALWGDAVGDTTLVEQATWMLSAEAHAARTLWLEPDLSTVPGGDAYAHGIVSLAWGGKRDYATWFSAEPSAILGIQLIPVSPIGYAALGGEPEHVRRNVAEAGGSASFDRALGDYVLAYSALGGTDAARAAADALDALPDAAIDPGNARSLMLAWLAGLPT